MMPDKQFTFQPNRAFKKDYDKLFKEDPLQANMLLLMCEIADEKGTVFHNHTKEEVIDELMDLMKARFNDVEEYAL